VQSEWFAVEMRHLTALSEVARERSFGRAAAKLGYTQSAVSSQVATLEKIVGQRLLERSRRNQAVVLTAAGAVLLRHGAAIADELRRARENIAALAVGQAGRIRIGIYQSIGQSVIPAIVQAFARDVPRVTVELAEPRGGSSVLDLLSRRAIDVAFTDFPLRSPPGVHAVPLLRDDYCLVVQRGHRLDRSGPVALEALGGERLIFLGDPSQQGTEQRLASAGVDVSHALHIGDCPTLNALVAAGAGVGVVPALAVRPSAELAQLELRPPLPPSIVALAWQREQLSPAVQRFITVAREVAASVGPCSAPDGMKGTFA
jgi:DNA-binding transcriptional LysR family regulator